MTHTKLIREYSGTKHILAKSATASIWGTYFFGGYSAGACFYGE